MAISNTQATTLNRANEANRRSNLGTAFQTAQTDIANLQGGSGGILVKKTETITKAMFTDVTTTGTYTSTVLTIPAGATYLYSAITAVTAFSGDTSAVIILGDGTTTNRYLTGTPSVFATAANGVSVGAPSGTTYHAAAKSVVATVTTASDFTAVSAAASVTVSIYYII